ncbi:hypothetical protein PAGA_a1503 [Pseudoalteromonas agarivorans DSM 14585]|uniref:Uncharacterized protein n=1 Tax=Pseudoalteromonas agarivorans DSM 14585 TaxID=1312369 RepID=A0ACA8DV13_9GAMM|nr:hypothetical protein PAGA_a1503 [Pseudoalteromonas agarivorans DSM 14585]
MYNSLALQIKPLVKSVKSQVKIEFQANKKPYSKLYGFNTMLI